ncbi:hypothetical protein Daus18300_007935 [Diaporthe australafricana]|uniref:5'-3' DNA helicase ZGRF1-like N-terminal domain-containing protein n=1 Tax=Diaporthe australafricana TaxID=127596 RepID=A0ABR3WKH9_9PEZI
MSTSAPSTATVLEFRCLFTHDLRRKQKRWQDGRLKYHSFNARIMVYDERGNSVGDMHWHGDYDFGEGEEVQLERGGVIVQVEELVERRETDLSELVDKRVQEKQQRQIQQLARSAAPSAVLPRSLPRAPAIALDRVQPRHRPLHHVIGTPTGHHGKALVPKESPFEQRQQAGESPDDRAAKRRKYDDAPPSKSGYAAALFGQSLTLSATPSSSVPAIRRPRPEPSSYPPEEADTPGIRERSKPARREQPPSSRRLAQPGYAQSLFGQTLTLSHTPVSSVPSRPQPRNEWASSPAIDEDKDPQETPRLPLQDQPTKSRLNESGSKPRSALLSNQSNMDNGMAKGSSEREVSGSHASVSRRHQAKKTKQIFPTDTDVIEIDDPDPVAPSPARQPRSKKGTPAASRKPEVHVDRSNVTSEQRPAGKESSSRPRKKQSLENQRKSESKKGKNHEKAEEAELAVAQATARNFSSEQVASAAQAKAARAPNVTTKPDVSVTELRIKSSKKRGLLMISDAPKVKKTRRQAATNPARSFEERSSYHSRDVDDHDPFRSPSPQSASKERSDRAVGNSAKPHTTVSRHTSKDGEHNGTSLNHPALNRDEEWDNEDVMGELEETSVQRTISTELGEDDDPFRSQPSELLQQSEPAKRDRTTDQAGITVQNTSNPEFSIGTGFRKEATDADQSAKHSSTPSKAGYDPYRIPSSPRPSNPTSPSSAATKGRERDVDGGILRPVDKNKKLSKAKQQRHSRRKVFSDEDDEGDTEPLDLRPKKASTGSGDAKAAASGLEGAASKKQQKSRKVASKKIIAQEDVVMFESGDEQPVKAVGKVSGQDKEKSIESDEDEQPTKRRRSTRQRRSRSAAYEEPSPLPSEQGDSEEEEAPRKRPKTKTIKASEDRPRLEKIKKNVKSRELIGFNLAALNAPLGFRGVGMPFSILSSPVNESIQRRVSNHAAKGETPSSEAIGCGDGQMLSPSPKRLAAPSGANAEVAQENPASVLSNETRDLITLASRIDHEINRNTNDERHLGRPAKESPSHPAQEGRGNTIPAEDRASGRPEHPAANPQISPRAENKQIGDTLTAKENKTSRQQFAAIGPRLGAHTRQTAAPTPLNNANGTPAVPNPLGLNRSAQGSSALPRQSSTGLKNVMAENATPEIVMKTPTIAQPLPIPAPAPATKPATTTGCSLQETTHSTAQQFSKASQAIGDKTEALIEQPAPAKGIPADLEAIPAARPLLGASLEQLELGIRGQASEYEPLSAQRSSRKELSNVSEGNRTTPAHGSAVLPPSREPTPALTRHSSTGSGRDSLGVEAAAEKADSVPAPAVPVQQPRAIGLRRQVSAPLRINNIAAKLAPQAEATESSAEAQARPAPNARIVNPASRGRKAALASHAAGQAPQRVLPLSQPALLLPISTADLAMTPIEQPAKEPERPKKMMRFPGFQSARSDGPWSREAFDLLESGRPE